ncbi:Cell wall integrity and stress response component 2 [Pestalotiopsis sp. IQ-011]
MTGQKVATSSSTDDIFEVFATHEGRADSVRILAAVRPVAGIKTYDITVTGLGSLGMEDSVNIQTYRYDDAGWRVEVDGPVDLGIVEHQVVDDQIQMLSPTYNYSYIANEDGTAPPIGLPKNRRLLASNYTILD